MPATLHEILDAISAAIVASATISRPWHEVTLPADLYEALAPELGEDEAHYGFAVHSPMSEPLRQGRGCMLVLSTTIEIAWSRVIGAERQILDQRAAFDDEAALLNVALAMSTTGRNPIPSAITRRALAGQSAGLIVGRIRVTLPHAIS